MGSGKVGIEHFDELIEQAAELPRKYGYAPKTENLYSNEELRKAARMNQFKIMDLDSDGGISLNEWIRFAVKRILTKVIQLPKDYLSGSADDVSKEEFLAFIKNAVNTGSAEYKELYCFLLRTFQAGDKEGYGEVGPAEFDEMIECAAAAPRRFGLAPTTAELFKSDADRIAKRTAHLYIMDTHCTGKITFDEWLKFAMEHIRGKVNAL